MEARHAPQLLEQGQRVLDGRPFAPVPLLEYDRLLADLDLHCGADRIEVHGEHCCCSTRERRIRDRLAAAHATTSHVAARNALAAVLPQRPGFRM